jgi:hypothetical protein
LAGHASCELADDARHRVTGYVPKAFHYPFEGDVAPQVEAGARVTFFDDVVDRFLRDIDRLRC